MNNKVTKIDNWSRQNASVVVIGNDGTILKDMVIKEGEDVVIQEGGEKRNSEGQIEFLKRKTELAQYTAELGGYIHMCYISNELLFNRLNIDRANISRIIYLATYIDYNNKEENLLVMKNDIGRTIPMTRKDISYKMKLSEAVFKKFLAEMKEVGLLYEANKKYYLNPDYFSRGKTNFKGKEYTRVFIDTTRILYEGCKPRQHKQLSYIFQLTPYIHYDNNTICHNPNETDARYYNKMSLLEICELLGISTNSSAVCRFEHDLLKFTIEVEGIKFYLFKRVIVKGGNGKFDYFVINPQVIWGGKDLEKARESIANCFFIENKK